MTTLLIYTFFIIANLVLDVEYYPTYIQEENYSTIGKMYMLSGAKASFRARLFGILGGFLTTWLYLLLIRDLTKEEKQLRALFKNRLSRIMCQTQFDTIYKGKIKWDRN